MVVAARGCSRSPPIAPSRPCRSGGKYRLIDIPLSNCLNSGINQIYVLTQFQSVSLHQHIRGTYRFDNFSGGFVEILAAQQSLAEDGGVQDWYQGTADAVRKNLRHLLGIGTEYVLILSGDQLYRMDFAKMLATHEEHNADVTIAAKPVARAEAHALGIMRVDNDGRVVGFREKPTTDAELNDVATDPAWIDAHGIQSGGRDCLASMGIYLFRRETLLDVLEKTSYHDFGREMFPGLDPHAPRAAPPVRRLLGRHRHDPLVLRSEPDARPGQPAVRARVGDGADLSRGARFLPPTRCDGATIERSLVADGCVIGAGTRIENSVVGLRCHIGRDVIDPQLGDHGRRLLRNARPALGRPRPKAARPSASARARSSTARSSTRIATSAPAPKSRPASDRPATAWWAPTARSATAS